MFVLQIIAFLLVATVNSGPVAAQKNWRTCKAYGGMHLETFDGAMFDYQGVCKLTLVDFCGGSSATTLPTFQVYLRGERRYGRSEVSYAEYVEIVYGGTTIRMARNPVNNSVDVTEDGVPISVPTITATYSVVADALYTIYRGPADLDVRYNGDSTVWVKLLNNYAENGMCGVCGNYNYDPTDDYVTQTGNDVSTDEELVRGKLIGDSWIVASDPEQQDQSKCPASLASPCVTAGEWVVRCDSLIDTATDFARTINCLGLSFMEKLRNSCLLDGCYSDGAAVRQIFDYLRDVIAIDYPQCAGCSTGGICAIRPVSGASNRIIGGGFVASTGIWPWQCRLRYKNKKYRANHGHFCGCSILTPRVVITAAHCVFRKHRNDFEVVAGDIDLTNYESLQQVRQVRAFKIRTDYFNTITQPGGTVVNDVALVLLCRPLKYTPAVQQIYITGTDYTHNETCYATGWGYPSNIASEAAPVLKQAKLTIVDQTVCKSWWKWRITDNMVCAGYEAGQGTCNGDSGGPLVCRKNDSSAWELVGVTSWGNGRPSCASATKPGVFTRVVNYAGWIKRTIQNIASGTKPCKKCRRRRCANINSATKCVYERTRKGRLRCKHHHRHLSRTKPCKMCRRRRCANINTATKCVCERTKKGRLRCKHHHRHLSNIAPGTKPCKNCRRRRCAKINTATKCVCERTKEGVIRCKHPYPYRP